MAAMSALFFYFHDIKEKKDNLLMISGMQFQSHYNVSTRHVKREVRRGLANIIFVKNEMEFIQDQQVEDAALCVCPQRPSGLIYYLLKEQISLWK